MGLPRGMILLMRDQSAEAFKELRSRRPTTEHPPCAVFDAERNRLARGRYAYQPEEPELVFHPTDNVGQAVIENVAFLLPDGEDAVMVTFVQRCGDGQFQFSLANKAKTGVKPKQTGP